MSFKNIQPGQRVKFRQYAGLGLKGPEYKQAVAPVNALLIFDDRVVVNVGGKFGRPQVVNAENFIAVVGAK